MADYISLMAADSKSFTRGSGDRSFKGCLGVCLGFTNPDEFEQQYAEFVNGIFEYGHQNRKVIKSFDLNKYFKDDRSGLLSCLSSFVSMLSQNEVRINAIFTTLNTKLLPDGIKKYGLGRSPSTTKKPLDFLDELNNYYPYIATWKVSKIAQLNGSDVALDSFTGEYTNAWGELCAHHNVSVIPKGDQCNPFISSADLVTAFIDEYLSQNHLPLNEEMIKLSLNNCDANESHVFYVGHNDFDNIVPIKKEKINLVEYYRRPMIYILKEDILKQVENKYIETSPLWGKLLNFGCDMNSGIKYISYSEDYNNIKDGDYLIYLGEKGKKQADYLMKLGHRINAISSEDILNDKINPKCFE
ncbi:MAG: hypothetical protein GQ533_01605 [Methanosarcinaceae archaeon]|nr:hypothetical protein [Methanosarcinaceae archaeon]